MPAKVPLIGEVLLKGDAPTLSQHKHQATKLKGLQERLAELENDHRNELSLDGLQKSFEENVNETIGSLSKRLESLEHNVKSLEEKLDALMERSKSPAFEKEVEAMFARQFSRAKKLLQELNDGKQANP